jgi:hypothetical protein
VARVIKRDFNLFTVTLARFLRIKMETYTNAEMDQYGFILSNQESVGY